MDNTKHETRNSSLPLDGVRVLDCTRVLAGPYCTMLLGDLGADVIKLEMPGRGDETRGWGPPFVAGESPYFWSANRNKRSLTLNLAHDEGRALFRRLVARCDILVDNWKAGTLERWGLDDQALWAINPRLVHAAITAYGVDGPHAARPGYDLLLQAEAGWMSITGAPDGPPSKAATALVDVLTGLYAAVAALAALREAEASGRGRRVDCSLLRSAVAGLINVAGAFLASGAEPARWGNAHATIVPYQVFATADRPIVLGVGNDEQWRRCCAVLEMPGWAGDARFATNILRVNNRDVLVPLLAERLRRRPAAEWLAAFVAGGIPAGPVNTVPEVFADPQVLHERLVVEAERSTALPDQPGRRGSGAIPLLDAPFRIGDAPDLVRLAPPLLGQHSDEILSWLGASDEEIERWRAAGVV